MTAMRNRTAACLLLAVALGWLPGCQQPNLEEMMTPAPRPAQLDKLDQFVGKWEWTGEIRMAGNDKVENITGFGSSAWDCNKRIVMERYEGTVGEHKSLGLGIWSWDPSIGKYRVWGCDSSGALESSVVTYDDGARTWRFEGERRDSKGAKSIGKGKITMTDSNTQEWSWTGYDAWGLRKLLEVKGTSRRK